MLAEFASAKSVDLRSRIDAFLTKVRIKAIKSTPKAIRLTYGCCNYEIAQK